VLLAKGRWVSPEDLPSHITAHIPSDHAFPTGQFAEESLSIRKASKWVEKDLIKKALELTGGNRTQAAKILEISRPKLLAKVKEYELDKK
jgi:two-component system response regulator AtoC